MHPGLCEHAGLAVGRGMRRRQAATCVSDSTSAIRPRGPRRPTISPSRRRPTGSASRWCGPPRRTARTRRPCSPGSPGRPTQIDVGTAVMQIPARTPAMTAMTAATIDTLQWRPVPARPRRLRPAGLRGLARRAVRASRWRAPASTSTSSGWRWPARPVAYDGKHYQLPLPDGAGKALRLTLHPVRDHIPIYLAAVGPKNLELTGEIADGWLAIFFAPGVRRRAARRRSRPAAPRPARRWTASTSSPTAPVVIGDDVDDVRGAGALVRGALHRRHGQPGPELLQPLATRMGYGDAAHEIQDLYLAKRQRGGGRGRTAGVHRPDQPARVRSTASPPGCATTPPPVSPRCPCRCSSAMSTTASARCGRRPKHSTSPE